MMSFKLVKGARSLSLVLVALVAFPFVSCAGGGSGDSGSADEEMSLSKCIGVWTYNNSNPAYSSKYLITESTFEQKTLSGSTLIKGSISGTRVVSGENVIVLTVHLNTVMLYDSSWNSAGVTVSSCTLSGGSSVNYLVAIKYISDSEIYIVELSDYYAHSDNLVVAKSGYTDNPDYWGNPSNGNSYWTDSAILGAYGSTATRSAVNSGYRPIMMRCTRE